MGILNRQKKKEDLLLEEAQPMRLINEDGKNINVFFGGLRYVGDKVLHSACIEYVINPRRTVEKMVLIEPVTREYDDGFIEDRTEKYFKQILDSANMSEDKEKYAAVRKFFGMKETEEDELKSDYIGALAQYDNGGYYRFFDDDFRIAYVREKLEEKELYW